MHVRLQSEAIAVASFGCANAYAMKLAFIMFKLHDRWTYAAFEKVADSGQITCLGERESGECRILASGSCSFSSLSCRNETAAG